MSLKQNFELMANYNQWMNEKVYQSAAGLSPLELVEERGVFFSSAVGTLNHIMVGDIIWLKRFANHPAKYKSLVDVTSLSAPSQLSEILYSELHELQKAREKLDAIIVSFSIEASEQDYDYELSYNNTKGQPFIKKFGLLVHHFYNHQTHHRGQVSALLSQFGVDVGVTDLLALIPEGNAL